MSARTLAMSVCRRSFKVSDAAINATITKMARAITSLGSFIRKVNFGTVNKKLKVNKNRMEEPMLHAMLRVSMLHTMTPSR